MKVIVAGPRKITDFEVVEEAIQLSGYCVTLLISGGAVGVDKLGEEWAKQRGVPIHPEHPDWKIGHVFDPGAGKERNRRMARMADALVAVWDGRSRGTSNMIAEMKALGKPVYTHYYVPQKPRAPIT